MPLAAETQTFTSPEEKKGVLARLARCEGQIRGIQGMIEREEQCEKIVQQLAAARSALNRAFYELIACAFETKLGSMIDDEQDVRQRIADLTAMLSKYA